jgi:SAM-dependent methyltransferase
MADVSVFFSTLAAALDGHTFDRATLSKPRVGSTLGLQQAVLQATTVRGQSSIAWTLRRENRDTVEQLSAEESLVRLKEWIGAHFRQADGRTATHFVGALANRRGDSLTYRVKPRGAAQEGARAAQAAQAEKAEATVAGVPHNREKTRLLDTRAPWLEALGLAERGQIRANAQAQGKWRQIQKFLEIIDSLRAVWPKNPRIADMGAGKGYLTFALYDWLQQSGYTPQITAVELRTDLVEAGRTLAARVGFTGLEFVAGSIADFEAESLDGLIALHACDTATDEALAAGIKAGASVLIVSPCCHKQVRRDFAPTSAVAPLMRHGILAERYAELVTDGLRALHLETHGYTARVFEFISPEHTAKNLMITAVRSPDVRHPEQKKATAQAQALALKAECGLPAHAVLPE